MQRPDDTAEALCKRLGAYREETEPILDRYQSVVSRINADQDLDAVWSDLEKALPGASPPMAGEGPKFVGEKTYTFDFDPGQARPSDPYRTQALPSNPRQVFEKPNLNLRPRMPPIMQRSRSIGNLRGPRLYELSTEKPRDNHIEDFIPAVFAVAFLMLTLTGLKKFRRFQKPGRRVQESLMDA